METTTRQPGIRVPLIDEDQAQGRTAELYEEIKAVTGLPFVPDMFRLTSTNPRLLAVVLAGYGGVFGGDTLPRDLKELISAWTSKLNGCPYCVGTHSWFLSQFGGSDELLEAVSNANTAEELPVDERTMPLMQLVTKVSTGAYKITDADWEKAAAAGWSDAEMLEAVFCACLFAFINRLVDATGLGSSVDRSRIARLGDE
ncbi:carboxymuconolactone decarboxylase family protein [Micromonospora sp. KC207]|uniref:carboxymuconolactone decarboxylase family protein n=1 Tax=Micromonospora sp. KC207 TaxID=2530377 RepID=UPI0014052A08|nr:carboxymuconolactone decarboxylase family protein [Micromonospora sp. KC207]